jgi:hypothetical protein
MKREDQTNRTKAKEYPEQEDSSVFVVNEPEVAYETKPEMSFEEDFNRALATALTPEEFLQDMYDFIDSLPWKER